MNDLPNSIGSIFMALFPKRIVSKHVWFTNLGKLDSLLFLKSNQDKHGNAVNNSFPISTRLFPAKHKY